MAGWIGRGPAPRPEQLEEDILREREHELDQAAERERRADDAVPRRHSFRRLFVKLRRKL